MRLALFSDDKPDRFFTVIKFWMDETSGVALALKTGVLSCQLRRMMKTDRIFGGRITQDLIRGRSLMVRWLRNRFHKTL